VVLVAVLQGIDSRNRFAITQGLLTACAEEVESLCGDETAEKQGEGGGRELHCCEKGMRNVFGSGRGYRGLWLEDGSLRGR